MKTKCYKSCAMLGPLLMATIVIVIVQSAVATAHFSMPSDYSVLALLALVLMLAATTFVQLQKARRPVLAKAHL